jgi:hypothetical protein
MGICLVRDQHARPLAGPARPGLVDVDRVQQGEQRVVAGLAGVAACRGSKQAEDTTELADRA